MRSASPDLILALQKGSFQKWYTGDLWYDGVRYLQDLPLTVNSLSDDEARAIKSQARVSVTWTDTYGKSKLPVLAGDQFSPFGWELAIYAIVSLGGVETRIPMGWFQIVEIPSMFDETMFWQGSTITTGSRLELVLMDRLIQVQRDEFNVPSAPLSTVSVWDEIGRLTGLPLIRSLADATISRAVAYQNDRLQAVLDLADILGGVPYMDDSGALTMRPKVWGAAVDTMRRGNEGSIVSIGRGMSGEGVYNAVVFRGYSDAQAIVWTQSEIKGGSLRTKNEDGSRSPAHRRPTFRSNEFVSTEAQARAYTDAELVRVSTLNSVKWPITETWNPLREVGDVVNVVDEQGNTVLCRIITIYRNGGPTQEVTVVRGG